MGFTPAPVDETHTPDSHAHDQPWSFSIWAFNRRAFHFEIRQRVEGTTPAAHATSHKTNKTKMDQIAPTIRFAVFVACVVSCIFFLVDADPIGFAVGAMCAADLTFEHDLRRTVWLLVTITAAMTQYQNVDQLVKCFVLVTAWVSFSDTTGTA